MNYNITLAILMSLNTALSTLVCILDARQGLMFLSILWGACAVLWAIQAIIKWYIILKK